MFKKYKFRFQTSKQNKPKAFYLEQAQKHNIITT